MIEFRIYRGLITAGETDQPDSDGLEPHHLSVRTFTLKRFDTHSYGKANLGHTTTHLHWHASNFFNTFFFFRSSVKGIDSKLIISLSCCSKPVGFSFHTMNLNGYYDGFQALSCNQLMF